MIAAIWSITYALSAIYLPGLADVYGRKKMYTIAVILQAIFFFLMFFTWSFASMVVVNGVIGAVGGVVFSVGPILMYESLHSRNVALIGTFCDLEAHFVSISSPSKFVVNLSFRCNL